MKRKLFILSILVICVATLAAGSLAYFTYVDTATNVITAGNIKISLREWAVTEEGGETVPFEDALHAMPGGDVSKIVQVENVGGEAAWVRLEVEKVIALAIEEGEADTSLISCDIDTENWTEKDGYYYYLHILAPGEMTTPLFTQVHFSKEMGNLYQNSRVNIQISAQATQVANNGETVWEAAGWPQKN